MVNEIRNTHGERLDFTYHHGRANAEELVVLGHGVTGNKDRPFVVALGEALARAGIPALRFSFSGNGRSAGSFAESNISKEVEDLGSVLDAAGDRTICYVGHSMGGAVGVLRAAKDPRIKLLVSLAGMVHTADFARREFGMVKPGEGFMWDDTDCPLSQKYMDDLTKLGSLTELGKKIQIPWLLVHGTEDDVVPLQDSKDIAAQAGKNAQLVEVAGANHVFAGDHLQPMVERVVNWIKAQWGR